MMEQKADILLGQGGLDSATQLVEEARQVWVQDLPRAVVDRVGLLSSCPARDGPTDRDLSLGILSSLSVFASPLAPTAP